MKKLVTLLLVLTGMVSTAMAKTIYLVNNWGKGNPKIYLFNSGSDVKTSWDGREALTIAGKLNSDANTNYYKLDLDSWTYFIISYDNSGDGNEQTHTLTAADYVDGSVYEFSWNESWAGEGSESNKKTELTAVSSPVYDYTLTITTADTWSNLYVWIWDSSENSLAGVAWPGQAATASEGNTYTFSYKSYLSTLGGVVFSKGNGQPQTGDMTIAQGSNSYYISTVTSSKVSDSDETHGLSVKTNAYGYATFVNYTAVNLTSGFAYYATDNENGSATARYLSGDIAANTGMLIKGDPNTTYAFAITTETGESYSTNAFKKGSDVTVASEDAGKYNYILNGDTFYKANGKKVAWNRAYLQLSAEAPNNARVLEFEDDNTTGVNSILKDEKKAEFFNLAGQRVAQPAKGLYIVNGKKYVVK